MNESHPLRAAMWMLGAVFSFSAMAVAGREMSLQLDTFEIMLYRSLFGILIVVSIAHFAKTLHQVSRQRIGLHFIRNISHFTGQNLWFYAIAMLPFAQVFAFEFSTPLWVALLAPFFLGEKLTRNRLLAALLGFVGILIVARPGSIALSSGVIAAALCAVGFAGTYIATKLLSRTESITCILFWLTIMQAVFGIIFAGFDGDIAIPVASNIPWLILVGCAGLLAHFCVTRALTLAPAVIVSPMDFIRLPLITLIGIMFYHEPFDIWVIVGAVVVMAANVWNMRTS